MKPRIFIGSSTKGLQIAELAQSELNYEGQPELWSNGIFRSINIPIENLMKAVDQFDFALFILLPEDPLTIRDVETLAIRDNVIFELGLFLGKLGREKVFFIQPKQVNKSDLHLPSDLSGITPSSYDEGAVNLQAAVGAALREFKQMIREHQRYIKEIVLDAKSNFKEFHFQHYGAREGEVEERGRGDLSFPEAGVLKIEKINFEGRYEVQYRPNGTGEPSIRRVVSPERVFKVTFQARSDSGSNELRFLLKDIDRDCWTSNQIVRVNSQNWKAYEFFLRGTVFSNLLFRIDYKNSTVIPGNVYISSLKISEER